MRIVILLAALLATTAVATEPIPGLLSTQGRIAENGVNFDGTGQFKFALVNGAGDTTLWSNDGSSAAGSEPTASLPVAVSVGHYSVLLGEAPMSEIPVMALDNTADVRLRTWFSSDGTSFEQLTPDRRVTPVAFALVAKVAQGATQNFVLPPTTATEGIVMSGEADRLLHTFGSANTFLGLNAGNLLLTSPHNTGIGFESLLNASSGGWNTAVGSRTLEDNTTGARNTALGAGSLHANTTASNNTAIGQASLPLNVTGVSNTGVGEATLHQNIDGDNNIAMGKGALRFNISGSDNTALGKQALRHHPDGSRNIAIGSDAGTLLTSGDDNILIGHPGLETESSSIRIGDINQTRAFIAGIRDVTPDNPDGLPVIIDSNGQLGTAQLMVGSIADGAITSAKIENGTIEASDLAPSVGVWNQTDGAIAFTGGNVSIDENLVLSPTTATTGILYSGASDRLLHTFGSANTFLGLNAGNLLLTSPHNTGIGFESMMNASSGGWNTAVGSRTLEGNTTGARNTALGAGSLHDNTTASNNTAIGQASLPLNVTGVSNTGVGEATLHQNIDGDNNIAMGKGALRFNVSGSDNTALGKTALRHHPDGSRNIAIGSDAGTLLTSGDDNILIGHIGMAAESSTIRIGDFNQSRAFMAGIRGVTPSLSDAAPVVIDSNGQLGTASAASPLVIVQEDWQAPTFQNGWTNLGGAYSNVGFFKDSMGIVHLRGMLTGGMQAHPMFTLPVGYRPESRKAYRTYGSDFLDITPEGYVRHNSGGNNVSLDGVTFRAAP